MSLGGDFGIVNIATDSDGKSYTGQATAAQRKFLTHIRTRLKCRRSQRGRLQNYFANSLPIKLDCPACWVLYVDPGYTSKACSCCGCIDDRNRPSQATSSCISCGHSESANPNAARNTGGFSLSTQPWAAQVN
jgi:transposase